MEAEALPRELNVEDIKDAYQLMFSSLIDSIQNRGLTINHAHLFTNGCFKLIVWCRWKNNRFCYRFMYNDSRLMLTINRRRFLFYSLLEELEVADTNAREIAEQACCLAFGK